MIWGGGGAVIIPYSTEVLIKKWPISNLAIMAACIVLFVVLLTGGLSTPIVEAMILDGWNPIGLIGYQFIHAGTFHLVFNMLYLWVFGNAVCEKIGNLAHAGAFLLTGVAAGMIHNVMQGGSAVGASGAINGIVGIYLVLYPVNYINCFYWFFRPGTFEISGFWLIAFWFIVDASHALSGSETGTAYWAHVGGFLAGVGLGIVFLKTGLARMAHYDNPTLLDYMTKGKRKGKGKQKRRADEVSRRDRVSALATSMVHPPAPKAPKPAAAKAQDINIDCPHCSQNLDVPATMIGQAFECPSCGNPIELEEG